MSLRRVSGFFTSSVGILDVECRVSLRRVSGFFTSSIGLLTQIQCKGPSKTSTA